MVKFILFGGFSVLATLYVSLLSFGSGHGEFILPMIPLFGSVLIGVSSAFYLKTKNKLATLLAIIGLGFVSQSMLWSWTQIHLMLVLDDLRYFLLLLPGLGTMLLYFIVIQQYLKPETNQFEFIKIKVGKVEQDILVYAPVTLVVLIVVYFKFIA